MQYTENEIVREYVQAKYRNKKIGVLSQLNCCSRAEIIEILERHDINVPKEYKRSKEEEYSYKALVSGRKDEPKPEPKPEPVKEPKPESKKELKAEPIKEPVKKSEPIKEVKKQEKELGPIKEPLSANLNLPKDPKEHIDIRYEFIAYMLSKAEKKLKKMSRKQKKLEKLYKDLAHMIMTS